MSKATYNTKKQTLDFGEFLVSDERRLYYRRKCAVMVDKGLPDAIPWTIAIRMVTDLDYKLWKLTQGDNENSEKIGNDYSIINSVENQ